MRSLRVRVFVFLLLWCLPVFGQVVYQEIAVPPELVTSQVSSVSLGTDGALWMFLPNGKTGTSSLYRSTVTSVNLVANLNGLAFTTSIAWNDSSYSLSHVPSPQGKDSLLSYNNPNPGVMVIMQANGGTVKTLCSAYTVDGGKGAMPQHLTRGPFPNLDGTYSLVSTTITKVGTANAISSTLFELGAVDAKTATCDLRTVVTVDKEIVQAVKQPSGKFLVNQVVLPAGGSSWLTRVGLLGTDGSYADLVSTASPSFPAARCCYFAQDYGTPNAMIAYFGKDGKGHGVGYVNGMLQEVFNSGVSGQLTTDIWVNDYRADVALFGGSNIIVGAADELVAVNTTTKQSVVVGAYDSGAIQGTKFLFFQRGNATADKSGYLFFEAYNAVDKTSHLFKATVPGITQMPVTTIDSFTADSSVVVAGDPVTLSWSTRNATTVAIQGLGIEGGLEFVPTSGSVVTNPLQNTTTYLMTATGSNGFATASVKVNVTPRVLVPLITTGGVVNAASMEVSAAPGTFLTAFGTNLCYGTESLKSLPLPTILSGCQVLVNGTPAPLTYVSFGQINFLLPYEVKLGIGVVQVIRDGVAGNGFFSTITPTAPGVFLNGDLGISTDLQNRLISTDNPSTPGDVNVLWLTGLGLTKCSDAKSSEASNAICDALANVKLTIGGQQAIIDYAGLQPTCPGLYQVNYHVPFGTVPVVPSSQKVLGVLTAGNKQIQFNTIVLQQVVQ